MMNSDRFHAAVVTSWLALGGCGPQTGTDSGSGEGTAADASSRGSAGATSGAPAGTSGAAGASGTSEADSALPGGCVCRLPDEDAFFCPELANVECEAAVQCPEVIGECMRANPDMYACEDELRYNEDALMCALEALRDRTPGTLRFDVENAICGLEGCGSDQAQITIGADERVVAYRCTSNPIGVERRATSRVTLADPDYFSGCLDRAEPPERYRCLLEGVIDGAELCE